GNGQIHYKLEVCFGSSSGFTFIPWWKANGINAIKATPVPNPIYCDAIAAGSELPAPRSWSLLLRGSFGFMCRSGYSNRSMKHERMVSEVCSRQILCIRHYL